MRTDYLHLARINGKEAIYNKDGSLERRYIAQVINRKTMEYMASQNFLETECEDIFQGFNSFFSSSERIFPKETSKLQDDAYYIQPEQMLSFVKFLKNSSSIYYDASKRDRQELDYTSEKAQMYRELSYMLSKAQDLMKSDSHSSNVAPEMDDYGELCSPFLPHHCLVRYAGNCDLRSLITEYIEDLFHSKENYSSMNDEDYTLFVKEIAQYVINVLEPLDPDKKERHYSEKNELLREYKQPSRMRGFYFTLIQEIEEEITLN